MDYEKKYKEALERLKGLIEGTREDKCAIVEEDIIDIFPELTETEDERIRKDFCKDIWTYIPNEKAHKYIAWLEKQGAQKPIDKVEPKFKEGDWIVNNDSGDVFQVTEIRDDEYCLWPLNAEIMGYLSIIDVDNEYHFWTIQDAKDGDVLCYKDEIFIYKHDIKNCTEKETSFGGMVYYCCYDGKRFITDSMYSLTEKDKDDIHPSTKEQRDLLFQKMKETGYEWDSEKKELRIVQKPKWSDDDEQYLLVCKNALRKYQVSDKWDADIISKWLEDKLKQGKQGEKTSKWTEEDDTIRCEIIRRMEALDHYWNRPNDQKLIDWLKGLKQRMEEQQ